MVQGGACAHGSRCCETCSTRMQAHPAGGQLGMERVLIYWGLVALPHLARMQGSCDMVVESMEQLMWW